MDFWKHPRDDGTRIYWPGGGLHSRTGHVVQPPAPDTPAGQVLARFGFTCKIGQNCYEIVNSQGDALELPFDDHDWEGACAELLQRFGR